MERVSEQAAYQGRRPSKGGRAERGQAGMEGACGPARDGQGRSAAPQGADHGVEEARMTGSWHELT